MVDFATGHTFAQSNGLFFLEVSAKNGSNIVQVFHHLGEKLKEKFPKKFSSDSDSPDSQTLIPVTINEKRNQDLMGCCRIL